MHILSARNRSEFLAVPQLVRFDYVQNAEGREPTLLIKSTTLMLKYLLRLKRLRLMIFRLNDNLLAYGIQIDDDTTHPGVLWSLLTYEEEIEALRSLGKNPKCMVFLFNELAVNVGWGEVNMDLSDQHLQSLIDRSVLKVATATDVNEEIGPHIDAILRRELTKDTFLLELMPTGEWHPVDACYITNRAKQSPISIFHEEEGAQQEEIALWLIDNLQPTGAWKSPQIHEAGKIRELCDLLMSHRYGSFLFESKALNILSRTEIPTRNKLTRDLIKHLKKAIRQLLGGVKNLRRELRITDSLNNEIMVERAQPPHIVVLVPDLSLLSDANEFGGGFVKKMCAECGGFFHILDPSELLRMVQAAEMIAARGKTTTPIQAFDYYLIERAKKAVINDTPDFGMLLRFEE